MIYIFNNIIDLLKNPKNIDTSQNILVKNIYIIYSIINFFINIKTKYNFCKYYYFKDKIILLLLSLINLVYLNTDYSIILYNIAFF